MYKSLKHANSLLFDGGIDSVSKVSNLDSSIYKIQRLMKKIVNEKRNTVFQNPNYMRELFDYMRHTEGQTSPDEY